MSPSPSRTRLVRQRASPHTLRHTTAMTLLAAGVETSVIAVWLGHEHIQTTQIYLHGDLTMKQRALDRTTPPDTPRPVATARPTRSSPSSKPCDYVDSLLAVMPADQQRRPPAPACAA